MAADRWLNLGKVLILPADKENNRYYLNHVPGKRMKRFDSSTAFLIALVLLIGALAIGSLNFLNQMNNSYILVQQGITPAKRVIDNHQYLQNKKGFIFAVSFLVMGASLFIMIALPSEERRPAAKMIGVPQPVPKRAEEVGIAAAVEPPTPAARPEEIAAAVPPAEEAKAPAAPVEIIEEVGIFDAEALEEITEGEEDVVYGVAPISDAAVMQFVHKFPDSALKFLFRKQLDGKALTSADEEIYQQWEQRQLTRGKIKAYIQTMMSWKEIPKKPLYEIWRDIRDHIFENIE